MMPSVVKTNPTVSKEGSAAAGSVRKPTTLDVQRKRSQLLVGKESSRNVKSGECSAIASSKSSSAGCRSSKLADGSVSQKEDLTTHGAAVMAKTATGHAVTARNPTVRTTRVKSSSSVCAKSGTSGDAEKSSALKMTSASAALARVSNTAKTAVHRKPVAETSRRDEVLSSVDKRKSGTVAASLSGSVKHEVSLRRSSRVPASSQTKTSSTASSLAAKKPRLKQANGTSSATSRTSVKRDEAFSAAVKLAEKKQNKNDADDKSVSSRSSSSSCVSKVTHPISAATVDGSTVKSDQVTVSDSVHVSLESHAAININSSLCNVCVVNEPSVDADEVFNYESHVSFESPHCESMRSGMHPCEYVSKSTDVTASVTYIDENGSDLEETSVCDVSLNSCLSDCSTSLFHSACSSVIGSISDMKPPSLDGSIKMENDHLAELSGSNSVSVESLHSNTGYCTPSEADKISCEAADCTLLNTDDSRYVPLLVLLPFFAS